MEAVDLLRLKVNKHMFQKTKKEAENHFIEKHYSFGLSVLLEKSQDIKGS
jgi:hypothetical protein